MITFHRNYIEVRADTILYWWSRFSGTGGRAKAGAFFPFIYTSNKIDPARREAFINHELIHFAQQREMLLVGGWVLLVVERIYWQLIRRKRAKEAYVLACMEQEAYDNMEDFGYLQNRQPFRHLRYYLKHKPVDWRDVFTSEKSL